jgi:hypothetical protein
MHMVMVLLDTDHAAPATTAVMADRPPFDVAVEETTAFI